MNLYELSEQLEACIKIDDGRVVDTDTGEILDLGEFECMEMTRDQRLENLALYIKNENARADAIKAEAKKLLERAKSHENEAARCKEYLAGFFANYFDGKKFETARVKLSWRASEVVEVNDIGALPDDYLRFKEPEPDKAKLKAALKAGVKIGGCQLVAKQNLQIK